jgi:hypothetical protein
MYEFMDEQDRLIKILHAAFVEAGVGKTSGLELLFN